MQHHFRLQGYGLFRRNRLICRYSLGLMQLLIIMSAAFVNINLEKICKISDIYYILGMNKQYGRILWLTLWAYLAML